MIGNDKIPRLIVANKSDLSDKRKISKEEGERLANELQCPYLECSAKDSHAVSKYLY